MSAVFAPEVMDSLRSLSTAAVCNAIERLRVRMRNEGYLGSEIPNRIERAESMLGHAFTLRIRSVQPPMRGFSYANQNDWWDLLASAPGPKVIVIDDLDHGESGGSVAGQMHAAIFRRFGAVGLITNGAVRDVAALRQTELRVYAPRVTPSHAYAHIVSVGETVELAGLPIAPGDLLHGDEDGVVNLAGLPANDIPRIAAEMIRDEQAILEACASPSVSAADLRALIAAFERQDDARA